MNLLTWLHALKDEAPNNPEEPEPPLSPLLSHRLHDLENVAVKDLMVPRARIHALDVDVQLRRVKRLKSATTTFFPVYQGDLDHLLGWVPKQTVLNLLAQPIEEVHLADHVRPAGTIAENASASLLADAFLESASPFLIVKNDHESTVGIVTLAEFIELVFGFEIGKIGRHGSPESIPPLLKSYEL